MPVVVWAANPRIDGTPPSAPLGDAIEEEQKRLKSFVELPSSERESQLSTYDGSLGSADELCRMILQRLLAVARKSDDEPYVATFEAALGGSDIEADEPVLRRVTMGSSVTAGCFA